MAEMAQSLTACDLSGWRHAPKMSTDSSSGKNRQSMTSASEYMAGSIVLADSQKGRWLGNLRRFDCTTYQRDVQNGAQRNAP
jgi:hypothetical protein